MDQTQQAVDDARHAKIDPATVAEVWRKAKEACGYSWSSVLQHEMDQSIQEMASLSEKQARAPKLEKDTATAKDQSQASTEPSMEELELDVIKGTVPCKLATTEADAYQLDNDVQYKKWPRECKSRDIAISVPVLDHHVDRVMVECNPNLDNPWLRPDRPGAEDFYMLAFILRNPSATKGVTIDVNRFDLIMRDAGSGSGTPTDVKSIHVATFEERKTKRIFCNPFPIKLAPKERFVAQLLFSSTKHVPWLLVDEEGGAVIDIRRAYIKEYNGYCGRDHGSGPVVNPESVSDVHATGSDDARMKPPPAKAVGVFSGNGHYVDRKAGKGCVVVEDCDLTLVVDALGNVTWRGNSALDIICTGEAPHPTVCAHAGNGTLGQEDGRLTLDLVPTGARGVSMSGLDKHVWLCGNVRIEVPSTVELGGSCVRLGIGAADGGGVAATNTACRMSHPWETLRNASVRLREGALDLPHWGGRRRLLLKSVGTVARTVPVPK